MIARLYDLIITRACSSADQLGRKYLNLNPFLADWKYPSSQGMPMTSWAVSDSQYNPRTRKFHAWIVCTNIVRYKQVSFLIPQQRVSTQNRTVRLENRLRPTRLNKTDKNETRSYSLFRVLIVRWPWKRKGSWQGTSSIECLFTSYEP